MSGKLQLLSEDSWSEQLKSVEILSPNRHVCGTGNLPQHKGNIMSNDNRKPGRPKHSGKNDAKYLEQVADLMVKNPGLKKTPAIRKIVESNPWRVSDNSVERRFLRKWKIAGGEYLAAAQERRNEWKQEQRKGQGLNLGDLSAASSLARAMREVNPLSQALADMNQQHEAMKRALNPLAEMRDILDPPFMRQMREAQKQFDEILNPSWARALSDHQNILKGPLGF